MKNSGLSENIIEEIAKRLPLPLAIVISEEIARELSEAVMKQAKLATKMVTLVEKVFTGELEILRVKGRGTVRELIIITDSPNYVFHTMIDDRVAYNHSYDELLKLSDLMEDLDVITENSNYILRVSKISFINEFRCVLKSTQPVKLSKAVALYDIFT